MLGWGTQKEFKVAYIETKLQISAQNLTKLVLPL